ncbi:hypothetical protein D1O30_17695 [Methylocystis hirsuta]|uniref:WYL domain-containing protein n=1 Tax=Methylocystis hirsuta TaxID=369798 RepID=A0A3M9XS81_9HYPH|nr:hypothetical protein D1O30_17695 [Methylocystis hirsuta]
MPSVTFEAFRQAIVSKKQIVCTYHGLIREVCPHTLGYNQAGGEQALVFQFAGQSSKGLPPGGEWRCLDLSQVNSVSARDGQWHTAPNHSLPQTCVARVTAEVSH